MQAEEKREEQRKLGEQLLVAAKNGKEEEIQFLLDKGADVNYKNIEGCAALHVAAEYGHANVVAKIFQPPCGATVDLKDEVKWTPLHVAASCGHDDVVRILLEKGKATVDCENEDGGTPLCLAMEHDHFPVVTTLLQHKASVDFRYEDGSTPCRSGAPT